MSSRPVLEVDSATCRVGNSRTVALWLQVGRLDLRQAQVLFIYVVDNVSASHAVKVFNTISRQL